MKNEENLTPQQKELLLKNLSESLKVHDKWLSYVEKKAENCQKLYPIWKQAIRDHTAIMKLIKQVKTKLEEK